jgi:hypothetical protein
MASSKRKRIVTPVGRLAWCHVIQPHEDLSHRMVWDVALEVAEAAVEEYQDIADELIENARSADPKFPKDDDNLHYPWCASRGLKKEDGTPGDIIEGVLLIKAKRRCIMVRNGQQERNTAPILQDSMGQPIKEGTMVEIPSGSEARLMLDMFSYNTGGNAGVSFGLVGLQLKQLAATETFDPLDPIEPGDEEEVPF